MSGIERSAGIKEVIFFSRTYDSSYEARPAIQYPSSRYLWSSSKTNLTSAGSIAFKIFMGFSNQCRSVFGAVSKWIFNLHALTAILVL